MNYQREGLLLPTPEQPAVDDALFASFEAAHTSNVEVYRQMSVQGERKAAVMEQLRNGEDIDLTAHEDGTDPEADDISGRLAALKDWKKELIANEDLDPEIKQAYRWRVNEDIANLHMLDASRRGDMRNFRRWNKFIYGEPDETVYRAALDWVAHDAEIIIEKPGQHPNAIAAAQNVLDMLEGERGYRELLIPDEETFNAVRDDQMSETGYFGLMLAGVDVPKQKITPEVGDPILQHMLEEKLQSGYTLIDSPSKTWSMVHSQEAMERPPAYNMLYKRFMGLAVGHEPTHLVELMNGRRGPVKLASSGLDRYENTNEGRAIVREQVQYDTFDEFGKIVRWRDIIRRHIMASYGWGVGNDGPRTTQEVYQFVNTIDTMYQTKLSPEDPELIAAKAHDKTASLEAREQRGVKGDEGGAYLKDIVYLEGHVAVWLTAAMRGAKSMNEGDLGKFDITNPRHITLLQRYGLLPDAKMEED